MQVKPATVPLSQAPIETIKLWREHQGQFLKLLMPVDASLRADLLQAVQTYQQELPSRLVEFTGAELVAYAYGAGTVSVQFQSGAGKSLIMGAMVGGPASTATNALFHQALMAVVFCIVADMAQGLLPDTLYKELQPNGQ